jgi:WD40 repeat protein
MKGYIKILGLTQSTLLLFGIFLVGSLSAQTRSLIVWSQQETENTTHNGAIAYSPDGQLVASGRADSNDVNIWNAADGSLVRTLNGQNNNANVIRFSPDGQYLATGTGGGGQGLSLNLWRVSDGVRVVGRIGAFTNGTISLSFSPDSQFLVASGFAAEAYKIYHVPDMSLVSTVANFDPDLGINTRIFAVAFSTDGQLIAVGETRGISLRRATDGSLVRAIHNLPNMMKTVSLAFSPNGLYVAGGISSKDPTYGNCIDCSIKLFRIDDGTLVHTYTNGPEPASAKIGFSPDGRIIGAGYADNGSFYGGAAQFWVVSTEQSLRRDPRDFWVQDFAYSPSGKFYAFFGADGVIAVARAPFLRGIGRVEIK